MKHILYSTWSIALCLSCVIHAGMLYSMNLRNSDPLFAAQMQTIEVSLLPSLPQQKTSLPPKKILHPQTALIKANKKPQAIEHTAEAETQTEITPIQTTETPSPQLQPPRFNVAYLNNPPPAYPLAARRRNIEGKVWVRAEIQADGSCSQVELKTPSASELLNQAALDAVKKWRFVPATLGGQTLTAWVEIPITFKLNN